MAKRTRPDQENECPVPEKRSNTNVMMLLEGDGGVLDASYEVVAALLPPAPQPLPLDFVSRLGPLARTNQYWRRVVLVFLERQRGRILATLDAAFQELSAAFAGWTYTSNGRFPWPTCFWPVLKGRKDFLCRFLPRDIFLAWVKHKWPGQYPPDLLPVAEERLGSMVLKAWAYRRLCPSPGVSNDELDRLDPNSKAVQPLAECHPYVHILTILDISHRCSIHVDIRELVRATPRDHLAELACLLLFFARLCSIVPRYGPPADVAYTSLLADLVYMDRFGSAETAHDIQRAWRTLGQLINDPVSTKWHPADTDMI